MSVDLVATVGSASANAFADVDYADAYLEGRGNATAWSGATEDVKSVALVDASRELSALESLLQGYRTDATQALAFPRTLVINTKAPLYSTIGVTGYPEFADDIVPVDWKNATCELALEFLRAGTTDVASLDRNAGVIEKTLGPIRTVWAEPTARASGLARFPRVLGLVEQFLAARSGVDIVRC